MRADQLLLERGLATSRSQAQRLIAAGVRWFDGEQWRPVTKNGNELPDTAQIELLDAAEARYVSRGGLKLEGALKAATLQVQGLHCLDVGHGQLHDNLRQDARVTAVESVNARELTAEHVGDEPFDLITGDLSFISLTLVLPALVPLMKPGAALLMLVKPQFELQPPQIGKGGIVKDAAFYPVVEQRICEACAELGLRVVSWFDSPIEGGDGNREFFVYATKLDEEGA